MVFKTGVNVPINGDHLSASLDTPEVAVQVEHLIKISDGGTEEESEYHEPQNQSRKQMYSSEIVLHFLNNFEGIIVEKMNIKEWKCITENTLLMERGKISSPVIKAAKKKRSP